ncbi:hypothetical protein [Paenibacillus thermotolerans]|uniref:hypothetical protein n=1 Tax=Paenibacillus thermotolerans TaxID=3027807 RepID=UPI00236839A9|nr:MULTISPECIES: hypothetical protein [unclassified Paenibacillus]
MIQLENSRLVATIDKTNGSICSIYDKAREIEFLAQRPRPEAFRARKRESGRSSDSS